MRKVQKNKIGPSATPIFQYVPFFNLFTMFGHVTSSNMTPYVNHFFLILKLYFVTFLEMYTLYMITQILNEKKLFLVIASEIDKKNSDPLRILRVKLIYPSSAISTLSEVIKEFNNLVLFFTEQEG